jgi:uncharacterized protein (DUF362 family)
MKRQRSSVIFSKMKPSHHKNDKTNQAAAAISRRDFLKYSAAAGGALLLGSHEGLSMANSKSQVAFVSTEDRKSGVALSIKTLGVNPVKNKDVLIKPNFNTADPAPGSTHNDTLVALVEEIWKMGARSVSLGERSYPPTLSVMEQKGILPLMQEREVKVIDFDQLDPNDWVKVKPAESHWRDGFRVARPILEAECLVSTCCLKTHQYGGVFTMSLKLHVGVVPTGRHGYSYMSELHQSPHQREMIAEINAAFKPDLVVLDGVEAFVDGGPMNGKRARGNVFLASTDRVAIDAVGLAILQSLGSNDAIMNTKIFKQEQIARAVEIGLGATGPSAIGLVAADRQSRPYRDRVVALLKAD